MFCGLVQEVGELSDVHRSVTVRGGARLDLLDEPAVAVVIGGSAGIGLETARAARPRAQTSSSPGAIPSASTQAAHDVAPRAQRPSTPTTGRAAGFFHDLPTPIDHVMVTAGGPHYGPLARDDFEEARRGFSEHLLLALQVARAAAGKVRPGGTLLFMGGTGGRRIAAPRARSRRSPPRFRRSSPTSRSSSRRSASTSSPPASSTRRCRRRCSATTSTRAATSSARRSRSGASSDRPTSPRSPCTS